jgi:hypothetical protein
MGVQIQRGLKRKKMTVIFGGFSGLLKNRIQKNKKSQQLGTIF